MPINGTVFVEDPIIFIAGAIFLIPFLVQLRMYWVLRIRRYLDFSFLFLFVSIDAMISSLDSVPFAFEVVLTFSFVCTQLILILIAIDVLEVDPERQQRQVVFVAVLVFIGTVVMKYLIWQLYLSSAYTSLRISLGQLLELAAGIYLFRAFYYIVFIEESARAKRIRSLWLTTAVLLITSSILTISSQVTIFMLLKVWPEQFPQLLFAMQSVDFLVELLVLLISVLTLGFTLVYPESLLLSMNQLNTVGHLYKTYTKKQSDVLIYTETIVLDYLLSLPKELFDPETETM